MEHFQKPIHHCIHKCKLKCYQAHFRWAWGVAESFVVWWKPKKTNKVYTAWLSCTYERAPLNLSYQLPSRRHLFLADFSKIMSNHNLNYVCIMYYSSTVLFCIQWHSVETCQPLKAFGTCQCLQCTFKIGVTTGEHRARRAPLSIFYLF